MIALHGDVAPCINFRALASTKPSTAQIIDTLSFACTRPLLTSLVLQNGARIQIRADSDATKGQSVTCVMFSQTQCGNELDKSFSTVA